MKLKNNFKIILFDNKKYVVNIPNENKFYGELFDRNDLHYLLKRNPEYRLTSYNELLDFINEYPEYKNYEAIFRDINNSRIIELDHSQHFISPINSKRIIKIYDNGRVKSKTDENNRMLKLILIKI